MIIACPSCEASFRISPEALGEGRKVRCARCRTEWFASPEAPAPVSVEVEAASSTGVALAPIPSLDDAHVIDAIEADDKRDAPAGAAQAGKGAGRRWLPGRRKADKAPAKTAAQRTAAPAARRLTPRLRPVAVLAALGIATCGAVIGGRVELTRAAPSLASLYAAVGLPVNVRGLTIGELRSIEEIEEGVPLLVVTGAVRNDSGAALEVPRLRLAVTGGGDRELYAWTTVAARARLEPGETAAFRARLASPPADGRGVEVRFLARRDLLVSASR